MELLVGVVIGILINRYGWVDIVISFGRHKLEGVQNDK